MTESEKMALGDWYFASDKALSEQRMQAKSLCYEYNQLRPNRIKQRKQVLKQLLPRVRSAWIEAHFFCDYGFNIQSTGPLFINHNVTILDGAMVSFGSNVFIGPSTVIAATFHPTNPEQRAKGLCQSLPIVIGNDVWIGANVTVLGGAIIPDGSIIAANTIFKNSRD